MTDNGKAGGHAGYFLPAGYDIFAQVWVGPDRPATTAGRWPARIARLRSGRRLRVDSRGERTGTGVTGVAVLASGRRAQAQAEL